MNRRESLKRLAAGIGAMTFGSSMLHQVSQAATGSVSSAGGPKRVIFFMQNQGFDPKTCIPTNMVNSGSLASAVLPEPIKALQPFREKLHIINGLHGVHTSPSHSAFFGALGGYRGGSGMAPSGSTIDYELSKVLPETILPHLCIGMDSMDNMNSKPTVAALSASGAGKPIFMHSNPNHLYKMLYGAISEGKMRDDFNAEASMYGKIEEMIAKKGIGLSGSDKHLYDRFQDSVSDTNELRKKFIDAAEHLKKFAPKIDDGYTNPEFETDWHDRLLDVGVSALKAGTTNVLTIGSGRGEIFGSWKGLGIEKQGHNLGHMVQNGNPIWQKIRSYNVSMLVKIMEQLESVPEGSGTMMDNTLIVYTSNNADKQHTRGETWPVMLLGNCGGAFKTGQFTQYDGKRPINALYASILRTVGQDVERFNMSEQVAQRYDSGTGVLKEIIN